MEKSVKPKNQYSEGEKSVMNRAEMEVLLATVPKGINKNSVVFDCHWANSTPEFKCTLKNKIKLKFSNEQNLH